MILLKIDELREGMILQRDILSDNGRYIIPSGTILSQKHIRVLKIWGISEVYVIDDQKESRGNLVKNKEEEKIATPNRKMKDFSEEAARKKFMFNDLENPLIQELYNYYLSLACKEK